MKTLAVILTLAVAAPLTFVACDRTMESQTKTTSTDGNTKVEKKTVTQSPSGDTTVTREKKTVNENP